MDTKKIINKMIKDKFSLNNKGGSCPGCGGYVEMPDNYTSAFCSNSCAKSYGEFWKGKV